MIIRESKNEDIVTILKIYDNARLFMRNHGNNVQWNGYPNIDTLQNDMKNNNSYVIEDDGQVIATFALIIGIETTYINIYDGKWNDNKTYGTIHRVASDGSHKNITKLCFDYCISKCDYLRIDTHQLNEIMQNAILRYGFKYCGIIYVGDGTPRLAYDYIKE